MANPISPVGPRPTSTQRETPSSKDPFSVLGLEGFVQSSATRELLKQARSKHSTFGTELTGAKNDAADQKDARDASAAGGGAAWTSSDQKEADSNVEEARRAVSAVPSTVLP